MDITRNATTQQMSPPPFPFRTLVSTHARPPTGDTDPITPPQEAREHAIVKVEAPHIPLSPGTPLQEIQEIQGIPDTKPVNPLSPHRPFQTLLLGGRERTHTYIQEPPSFDAQKTAEGNTPTQRNKTKSSRKPRPPKASAAPGRFPATSKRGEKQCTNCSETDTPQWRGSLCNACALWKRSRGEDRPLPLLFPRRSPTLSPSPSLQPVLSPSPDRSSSRDPVRLTSTEGPAVIEGQGVPSAPRPAGVFWKRSGIDDPRALSPAERAARHSPTDVASSPGHEAEGASQYVGPGTLIEPHATGLRALATVALQTREVANEAAYVTPVSPLPGVRNSDIAQAGGARVRASSRPVVTIPESRESAYATPSGVERSGCAESAIDKPWPAMVQDRLIKSIPRRAPRGMAASLLITPASSSPAASLPDVRPGEQECERQDSSLPLRKRARRSGETEIADKFRMIEEGDVGQVSGWWDEEGESREEAMGRMGWLWDVLRNAERCAAVEVVDE